MNLKVTFLSKREISETVQKIKANWPQGLPTNIKSLKAYDLEDSKRLLVSDNIIAVETFDKGQQVIIPFLGSSEVLQHFPSVSIDMGAVKFICNGAKVTRPGITNFSAFKKGDIVLVRDQVHAKALAVGTAIENSDTIMNMQKGYVINTLHYIGDIFWEMYKQIH